MAAKAKENDVQLIPHFKTHQSAEVGVWFKREGVEAVTVTSVKMAKYFAWNGWDDITIAFPVNVLEIDEIKELASHVRLKIFVNNQEAAHFLLQQLEQQVNFYIEVDVGDHRSGLEADNFEAISEILQITKETKLVFNGFYTHGGHTYNARSIADLEKIHQSTLQKLRALKSHFRDIYPNLELALGDTPSCSLMEDFDGIDSIHPGNFVYYDLVQHQIGSNTIEEIAICLAVPVVSVHGKRQEVVVHGGWVHQGKDSLTELDGCVHYGLVVKITENGWTAPIPGAKVVKLSQEHSVIKLPAPMAPEIRPGALLGILPVHACATAVMMGEFYTLEGEKLEMMPR